MLWNIRKYLHPMALDTVCGSLPLLKARLEPARRQSVCVMGPCGLGHGICALHNHWASRGQQPSTAGSLSSFQLSPQENMERL